MSIREEFYDSLLREYELEGKRSFLYRYFQKRPRQTRGRGEAAKPSDADIRRDIRNFLYDVRHGRKKDSSLSMLDEYCSDRGISSLLTGAKSGWDRARIEETESFFSALQTGGNPSVLIPLEIDPITGAGLYMMGSYFFEETGLDLGEVCYACLWTEDLILTQDDTGRHTRYYWNIGSVSKEDLAERCGFPNLEEALRWFHHLTSPGEDAVQAYVVNNGPPPPDCPPALRQYFELCSPQTDVEELIAQGRESFLRENGVS